MTPTDQLARMATSRRGRTSEDRSRRELESHIDALTARVEQLERERDAAEGFAAIAGHELVAPLVMAEACAALAADRLPGDVGADVLATFSALGRSAARTRRLIETLLHESRATMVPLRHQRVDLKPLVGECISVLAPEIEARSAIVKVGDLPHVHGEPELLGGLFTNLLANALKYNPRQGGAVHVGAQRRDGDWTIYVDDEGPRIPMEDRERIFEPFHRGRGERRVKGAGLGLTICRRIVERHGGAIGIADAPTGGNRFAFTLPA